MRLLFSLACAATLTVGALRADDLVVRAGTIHPCGGEAALTGGAAIWIQDGKILAVGKDVDAPIGTPELDFGSAAVIAPGMVATKSSYGPRGDAARSAAPFVQAIDAFDPYGTYNSALRAGVTSVFLAPGSGERLIAGQGAVVKLAGEDRATRTLKGSTGITGSIASGARFAPGFWEPRLPATVDVGLGFENRQFPRTVMGAVVALRELMSFAAGKGDFSSEYGSEAGEVLGELIRAKSVWRMRAQTDEEVSALIELFQGTEMQLVIEGLEMAPDSAARLQAAGHKVIYQVTQPTLANYGKEADKERPDPTVAAGLANAGVPFAIQAWSPTSLRFAAALAMRGGLGAETALEAITYQAAQALQVADRVGSLKAGMDADLVVYNGAPMDVASSVLVTLVDGKVAYDAEEVARRLNEKSAMKGGPLAGRDPLGALPRRATVLSVEELHLGNGEVLSPGEILINQGRIVEAGRRVSRPSGAKVVTGFAAMPGAVDVLGHLGMEGQTPSISKSFEMRRMVEPGDRVDREVALAGTTTVNMTASNQPQQTTTLTYKPAGLDVDRMVVRNRGSLILGWPSGSTAGLLHKEKEYSAKWTEYAKKLSEWKAKPKKSEAEKEEDEEKEDEAKDEESKEESSKKKKKKKSKKRPEAINVTGTFEGELTLGDESAQKARLRIMESEDGSLQGTLRTADYPDLVYLEGTRDEYKIVLDAQTTEGGMRLGLELNFTDNEAEKPLLEGQRLFRGVTHEFSLPRVSTDYPVAKRPAMAEEEEKPKEKSGKPSPPTVDPLLEMLRDARKGKASIFVRVDRQDHIRSCVDAFAAAGIKPVLVSASEVNAVVASVRGRIAGVILTGSPVTTMNRGLVTYNRYASLQSAGIPVAFASFAEEGAAGLVDVATMAASQDWSPQGAMRALTSDAAKILSLSGKVGSLEAGNGADVLLLDGPPLVPSTRILNVWVNGREVQR
ncbi:MAG: amidohydrolase family protein [Planctomycetota bacterium]|nr:amidohydrolase family protein [Planctomycetota bacterium]